VTESEKPGRNEVIHTGENAEPMHPLPKPSGTWVHEVLEPDQLSTAKPRFGRRMLSRRTLIVLWALRIYAFLMLLLIALQIWNALHTGG
jgi:hypothetical protein